MDEVRLELVRLSASNSLAHERAENLQNEFVHVKKVQPIVATRNQVGKKRKPIGKR